MPSSPPRPAASRDRSSRAHGSYVFGLLVAMRSLPDEDRFEHQEIAFVATPDLLVTVRKTPPGGVAFDPAAVRPSAASGASAGALIHRLVDDVAETFLEFLDAIYGEIDELEDRIDDWQPSRVRTRMGELRHELTLPSANGLCNTGGGTPRPRRPGRRRGARALPDRDRASVRGHVRHARPRDRGARRRSGPPRERSRPPAGEGRRDPERRREEAHGDRVARPRAVLDRRLLRPEFRGSVRQSPTGRSARRLALIVGSTIVQVALFRWRRWI